MVRGTICLYDSDVLYGRVIIKALQEEVSYPITYAYFSEVEALCTYLKDNEVTLLLIEKNKEETLFGLLFQEDTNEEQINKWREKILLLTEEPSTLDYEIYKYLPRKELSKQLMRWWSLKSEVVNKKKEPCFIRTETPQIITGYITFGGAGLAKYLGGMSHQNRPNLILHLELFAYTSPHEKPKKNMSDLIYLASIDRLSKAIISDFIYTLEGVHYIEPIAHYCDGYECNEEVAKRLMEYLRTLSYEQILIVTDCRYRGAATLLELCDVIKVEEPNNQVERHKTNLIIQMLYLDHKGELLNKMKQVEREEVYG